MLDAGDIVNGGAMEIAAGKLLLVELHEFAGRNSLGAQLFELLLAAVDPDNMVGIDELFHLVDPG